jgi:hypothetical protein
MSLIAQMKNREPQPGEPNAEGLTDGEGEQLMYRSFSHKSLAGSRFDCRINFQP